MATVVDRLHADFAALAAYLDAGAEPSLRSTADETFRKALLLSAASYFETTVTGIILSFCQDATQPCTPIPEFVRNKALSRQYHTLFDWNADNANKFFSLFGDPFKAYMQKRLKEDASLVQAVQAFMEVGRERNRLVHMDFGTFALEKTSDEIYQLFSAAYRFVSDLRTFLDDFANAEKAALSS